MSLNSATPDFLNHLRAQLPAQVFREVEPRYLEEPRKRFAGQAAAVLAPSTAKECATIVMACNAARVGLIPYGGGTGLVGGQVFTGGPNPVILSLERMTRIRAVYPEENVLVAEAGAILNDIQAAAHAQNRLFPLSLASEGSCRIGGNLATNAGGVNVLRYGNTRDLCLGLEAVLPNGEILNGLTRLRKDNTGFDLRNLLIGSEGTLGIITAAALKLAPIPADTATALFVVPSPAAALTLLSLVRDHVGEAVSSFELIGGTGLAFLQETFPEMQQPFATAPAWSVLIELGLSGSSNAEDAMTALFADALERDLASDGIIAQSQAQSDALWGLREHIPQANSRIGSISSHDISIPLSSIADFIDRATSALTDMADIRVNCFGHLGDGNLHFNLFPAKGRTRDEYDNIRDALRDKTYQMVHEFQGSFSAEHGVGRLKTQELQQFGDPAKLAAMRAIKSALDPNGIMNPGAVLG